MELGLAGRKAFVTGASRGIGAAIASALAAEGVSVALFGRDMQRCEQLAAELSMRHRDIRAVAHMLDMQNQETVEAAIANAAATLGGCDILVNCAGGATRGRLADIAPDAWEANFHVKPLGLVHVTRSCLPLLRKSGQARIINIAGTRGREPGAFSVMSSPINMATLGVTKALANELGPHGITVNAINPGSSRF